MSYEPLAFAERAVRLLPYKGIGEDGDLSCRGKVYSCAWSIEAKKDPKCKEKYKEDGWSLLNKSKEELSKEDYEKFEILLKTTKSFMIKKAEELFPINDPEWLYFHFQETLRRGWR